MPYWILAATIFGLVILCDDSYEQALSEAEHTRNMVCSGYWPPEVSDVPVDCSDFTAAAGYSHD
jgi:hypothetical protein